jgi:hypothetical protein
MLHAREKRTMEEFLQTDHAALDPETIIPLYSMLCSLSEARFMHPLPPLPRSNPQGRGRWRELRDFRGIFGTAMILGMKIYSRYFTVVAHFTRPGLWAPTWT